MSLHADVREALHLVDGLEPSELYEEVFAHFGSAMSHEPQRVTFPEDKKGEPALTLIYDPSLAAIVDAEVGPALAPEDLTSIERRVATDLLSSVREKVASIYMFSRIPMQAFWRWEHRLQLQPAPPEAPIGDTLVAEYPLVLQVAFPGSTSNGINFIRGRREAHFWAWVLNLLLQTHWRIENRQVRFHWVDLPTKRCA